jgi:hypothetical protein
MPVHVCLARAPKHRDTFKVAARVAIGNPGAFRSYKSLQDFCAVSDLAFRRCFSCSTQSPCMRLRIKSAEVLACSLQLSIAGVTPSAFTRQVFNLASMIANSDGTCAEAEPHMRAQQIPIPNRFTINARAGAVEAGSVYLVRVCLRTASVARMSEATSGIPNPAYRCAHAGYLLCEDYGASI